MNAINKTNFGIVLILASMILLSSNIFAQEGQRKGEGPPPIPNETQINKMVDKMSVELSLGESQKSEILALHIDHFAETGASRENNNGQRKSREEMKSIRTEFEDEVKSLLNEEQKIKFEEFMKNQKKRSRPENSRR